MNLVPECSRPFVTVDHDPPHSGRARTILRGHPEVQTLVGTNRYSAVAILSLVVAQLMIGWALIGSPWWLVVGLAYTVGACANHGLWVLIHECTHHLIFKRRTLNYWMAFIANLPMVIPLAVSFSVGHIKHHKFLGDFDHDADMASAWEGRLLCGGFLGRLLWQALYPVILIIRATVRDQRFQPVSWKRWWWVNVLVQIVFVGIWFALFGRGSLLYLLLSSYFSVGPHPLGMRWIQEHYVFKEGQETYSYYGAMNRLAFNIGYHNEHHDIPSIPWNRLPALKRMVPEMYDPLYSHRSWLRMWVHFLLKADFSFYRIGRHQADRTTRSRKAA
jgi:sphingolipid delta-4 desaturase